MALQRFDFLKALLAFALFFFSMTLFGQSNAKEFLEMDLDKVLPRIERLSKEETKELITQIRQEAKASYPKIDHFYFLISHLEEVSAIEKEQARLRSLLWVFGLGLLLFMGFLGFLLLSQRKALQDIKDMTEL